MRESKLISNYIFRGDFTTKIPLNGEYMHSDIESLIDTLVLVEGSSTTLLKTLLFYEYSLNKLTKEELCELIIRSVLPISYKYDAGSKYDSRGVFTILLEKNNNCIYDTITELLDISALLMQTVKVYEDKLDPSGYDHLVSAISRIVYGMTDSIDFRDDSYIVNLVRYVVFYHNIDNYAKTHHMSEKPEKIKESFVGNMLSNLRYYLSNSGITKAIAKSMNDKDLEVIIDMLKGYDEPDPNGNVKFSGTYEAVNALREEYSSR